MYASIFKRWVALTTRHVTGENLKIRHAMKRGIKNDEWSSSIHQSRFRATEFNNHFRLFISIRRRRKGEEKNLDSKNSFKSHHPANLLAGWLAGCLRELQNLFLSSNKNSQVFHRLTGASLLTAISTQRL